MAVAPSAVPTERFRVMPRPLRLAEIREIIDGYGQAAARLQRAGLDGVEVVASHGYLPSQFLNPAVNLRTDEYGGTPEDRLRFLREAFESIRRHCGPGFVAGLRISLDERDPPGCPPTSRSRRASSLAADGLADYLSVTTGTSASLAGSDHIAPDMTSANGYVAPLAGKLRAAVDVPVLVAGRINQPQEAEQIIAAGQADACVMTRAMICDPDMPGLARAGQTDDIRACIGCNQACIGHFHLGFPISCIQHPETGRERLYGIRRRADRPKKVMVVGGGPAGLKAAAVAAERGHDVTLYEASGRVGGQVLLAERLPGREEFGGAITNLSREAARAGVTVRLRTTVDLAAVRAQAPDLVVVATGARPYRPPLEVMDEPVDCRRLGGDPRPGIAPAGQDRRGRLPRRLGRARHRPAARRGRARGDAGGARVRGGREPAAVRPRSPAGRRLAAADHRAAAGAAVRVDDDTVYLQHVLTEEPVLVEGVVRARARLRDIPRRGPACTLEPAGVPVVGVGDCLAPRTVEEAVLDGLVAASGI